MQWKLSDMIENDITPLDSEIVEIFTQESF